MSKPKRKRETPADEMKAIEALLFVAIFLVVVVMIVYGDIVPKVVGVSFAMIYFISQSEK